MKTVFIKPVQEGWLYSLSKKYLKSLSSSEHNAIEDYTRSYGHFSGSRLNLCARFTKFCNRDIKGRIKTIDRIIETSKLPKAITVYRGTSLHYEDRTFKKNVYTIGARFTDKGFVSTSLKKAISFNFGDLVLEIRLPKGFPAIYLQSISAFGGEKELLLPRNTIFTVLRTQPHPVLDVHRGG